MSFSPTAFSSRDSGISRYPKIRIAILTGRLSRKIARQDQ